ncbi:MAG: Ig-like domain-containing protein [Bacteroidaceae bacterium]|nr:Ig-like domain-containing protein [Bacteroidaceae bacterium]
MKQKNIKALFSASVLSALAVVFCPSSGQAQSVIFPQLAQPGMAVMDNPEEGVWVLSNALLTARYVMDDGKLRFGGCEEMDLEAGTELFEVSFGSNGSKTVRASDMTIQSIKTKELKGDPDAVKGSDRFDGKALEVTYGYKYSTSNITVVWRAVLRDGSHYLRTEMEIHTDKDVQFFNLTPMRYDVNTTTAGCTPEVVGNTRGAVVVSDKLFAGLETPMGKNTAGNSSDEPEGTVIQTFKDTWSGAGSWTLLAEDEVPKRVNEVGYYYPDVRYKQKSIVLKDKGTFRTEILYASGSHRLNICGVDLIDADGNVAASDYHFGFTGSQKENNVYSFQVPYAGSFKVRYLVETRTETITSSGNITMTLSVKEGSEEQDDAIVPVKGVWSRATTLKANDDWKVSSVVGLVAPGQQRRSFLAYSERERAVPWRAFPCYISWYELNIDRNNAPAPSYKGNMTIDQCVDVMNHWQSDFYDRFGTAPKAFVWDDGWDSYGTWTFSPNFPNGFREIDDLARGMQTGIGAWLGPVGGYGQSGNYRRQYWTSKGQKMELSNPNYYKVFKDAAKNLTVDQGYDFRFFKFDGISGQFSATGPDAGTVGEENAEGIIRLERFVREELKEDIFFNTTVGTWASPFWYHFTDATWRQENDYGTIGNNKTDRENWITYRDRLVYQNYVQNSPICPINTLMTHGFILSTHGAVSKSMDYEAVRRELRCAFACGSGMVELYNDYALMNSINGGLLWKDLAECMAWQEENADVLPDIHWVGGNPWDGSKANVYGWASWNGRKSTLALRNGANNAQTFKTTLRKALDIPDYVKGTIQLRKAFAIQDQLRGLTENTPIDIDEELTLTLPASSLFVFSGAEGDAEAVRVEHISLDKDLYELSVNHDFIPVAHISPLNAWNKAVAWECSDPSVATIDSKTGLMKTLKKGTCTITATTEDGGMKATATVVIDVPDYNVSFDKDANASRSDRYLNSVGIAIGSDKQTASVNQNHKPYQKLEDVFTCAPGEIVTPSVNWKGSWMHSYVYIDLNQNKQFDVTKSTDDEIVSFTYYAGKNSKGASAAQDCGVGSLPSFTAPAKEGEYMMRFKIDWNCIDPAGNTDSNNLIISNGGSITDIILRVNEETDITNPTNRDSSTAVLFDLQGRSVSTPTQGIYIRSGKKVLIGKGSRE